MNLNCRTALFLALLAAGIGPAAAKDPPPHRLPVSPPVQNSLRAAPLPPPGGTYVLVNGANTTVTPLPDLSTVTSTITLAGAGTTLWDLDATIDVDHTFAADQRITLTSPAGTVVTLSSNNGGGFDNVFAGTLFDDQAGAPVTDFQFTNLVTATPLAPEEPLDAFRGENPNGVWTLTIEDQAGADIGTLNGWSLAANTLATAPAVATTTFSDTPNLPIGDLATVTDTITVSGAATHMTDLTLVTGITHSFPADLEVTLTSPAGTVVTITTENGDGGGKGAGRGVIGNTFNGTNWFNDAQDPVTDFPFSGFDLVTPLSPEESLAAFSGENPNGTWTITVTDVAAGDAGTLLNWSLAINTVAAAGGPATPVPATGLWSLLALAGLLASLAMLRQARATA